MQQVVTKILCIEQKYRSKYQYNVFVLLLQLVFISLLYFFVILTLDMLELGEGKYFTNGTPVDSVVALSAKAFRTIGEIMVMSILQGGPAPNLLSSATYSYVSREPLSPNDNTNALNKTVTNKVIFNINIIHFQAFPMFTSVDITVHVYQHRKNVLYFYSAL